jgi:hypothetical protein
LESAAAAAAAWLVELAFVSELRLLLLLLSMPKEASASMDLRRFVDALSRLMVACGRSLQQCETPITTTLSHHCVQRSTTAWTR